MVQDKANGTIRDLRISPVKSATLSLSYYVATLLSTLIICFAATGICLTYVAIVGWYMSLADIFFLFLDILLLVLFGTALSSIIKFFLINTRTNFSGRHNHQCGIWFHLWCIYAYFFIWKRAAKKVISFLPGTYGISLIRNHTMQGALAEIQNQGIPIVIIEKLKDSLDCNLYFFRKSSKYWNDVYDTWHHYFGIDWNLYFVKQIEKIITVNLVAANDYVCRRYR